VWIIQITDSRPDPRAREPKWYLIDQVYPLHTSESPGIPSLSGMSFLEKYHETQDAIMTNSLHATMNETTQKMLKKQSHTNQVVYASHSTVLSWLVDDVPTASEIEPMQTIAEIQAIMTHIPNKK
jgi:hypothetical protein